MTTTSAVRKGTYVDGFVLAVPTRNVPAYRKLAKLAAKVWVEHGALEYVETTLDDAVDCGGIAFPTLASCKRGETAVFSYIVYRSKADRNRVNAAVMNDPRMQKACGGKMPFDVKRMAMGGFKVLLRG